VACLDDCEPGLVEKRFAILGKPVEHSKSPQIHAAAYDFLGLDWSYESFEVDEKGLGAFLDAHPDYSGFSLTMPLKNAVYDLVLARAGQIDDASELLKAGNTLSYTKSGPTLFNTDVYGVVKTLRGSSISSPSTVALLGSGATSRSCLLGLLDAFDHLGSVTVFSRNQEAAANTIEVASKFSLRLDDIQWLPLEAAADFGGADLTVNTLPARVASQLEVDVPIAGGWLFDVSYDPWPSQLSKFWSAEMTISGLEMLLWQALAQIRIFVHGDPMIPLPNEDEVFTVMRSAVS